MLLPVLLPVLLLELVLVLLLVLVVADSMEVFGWEMRSWPWAI